MINALERALPAAPIAQVWEDLKANRTGVLHKRYAEFGVIERLVPFVFAAIYVAAIVKFGVD